MSKLPKAKTAELVIQESGNELLLYNLTTNKAYCLNETSAIVYQACDGNTTFAELKKQSFFTDELIFLALDGLKRENLLDENYDSPFEEMTRRQVIKKIGLSSMLALPVISSIIAPTSVMAQSCNGGIPGGGILDGQFLSTNSTNGICSTHTPAFFNEFCVNPAQTRRCCSNTAHYNDCTTIDGSPFSSPPFSAFTCYCGL